MQLMDCVAENRMLSRWAEYLPRSPRQIGVIHESDAELVQLGDGQLLALTVDGVVEEIELGIYKDARTAGRAAAAAALSDLAAVGADPLGVLLSVGLPDEDGERVQRAVAEGVLDTCSFAGTFVLGGDTSRAAVLSVTCVAAGLVPERSALSRLGLSPGDTLFASGPLGSGAALAAAAVLGLPGRDELEASWRPRPRLAQGRLLRGVASACMDTSDGLVATLDQLARLNRVAIRLDADVEALLDPRARDVGDRLGLSGLPFLAAAHGEHELVFGVSDAALVTLSEAAGIAGWKPSRVGRVEQGAGLFVGSRPLDGAAIRNLASTAHADLPGYVRALCCL